MLSAKAYAAKTATSQLAPFNFSRREVGADDVLIEISHCGVCHSDIHQARDEWGGSIFPMVPGHEIVGRVTKVGANVKNFKAGDLAGVGCMVDSCRTCGSCKEGLEQYCEGHAVVTYNGLEKDLKTPTYGGYSNLIVVDEKYTLKMPSNLDPAASAPLLCAGVTTWSPLRHWKVGPGMKLGVVGLGGLGHMAVKLGASMGSEVTVFSTSRAKQADAARLGARNFVATAEKGALESNAKTMDLIINTVSAPHNMDGYLNLLKRDGTMVLVGVSPEQIPVSAFSVIGKRRRLAGSLIGGIKETQEMLDYCGKHNITSDIELIPIKDINDAYERMIAGKVRYRFVIDMKTL
ncbi:MAG: hypothetical protein RIQ81_1282 [Pseudomonadota bacterium]|jgi:uncharacterized zinc-type alcohol dehydrogenase-like protein